jgi:hypothetical protein
MRRKICYEIYATKYATDKYLNYETIILERAAARWMTICGYRFNSFDHLDTHAIYSLWNIHFTA